MGAEQINIENGSQQMVMQQFWLTQAKEVKGSRQQNLCPTIVQYFISIFIYF